MSTPHDLHADADAEPDRLHVTTTTGAPVEEITVRLERRAAARTALPCPTARVTVVLDIKLDADAELIELQLDQLNGARVAAALPFDAAVVLDELRRELVALRRTQGSTP